VDVLYTRRPVMRMDQDFHPYTHEFANARPTPPTKPRSRPEFSRPVSASAFCDHQSNPTGRPPTATRAASAARAPRPVSSSHSRHPRPPTASTSRPRPVSSQPRPPQRPHSAAYPPPRPHSAYPAAATPNPTTATAAKKTEPLDTPRETDSDPQASTSPRSRCAHPHSSTLLCRLSKCRAAQEADGGVRAVSSCSRSSSATNVEELGGVRTLISTPRARAERRSGARNAAVPPERKLRRPLSAAEARAMVRAVLLRTSPLPVDGPADEEGEWPELKEVRGFHVCLCTATFQCRRGASSIRLHTG